MEKGRNERNERNERNGSKGKNEERREGRNWRRREIGAIPQGDAGMEACMDSGVSNYKPGRWMRRGVAVRAVTGALVACMLLTSGGAALWAEPEDEAAATAPTSAPVAQTQIERDPPLTEEELADIYKHLLRPTENTVIGVTGPDGQVISGYTWEMYDASVRERAKDGIRLKIGGNTIEFPDQKPVLMDGRVLVPMRPVLESVYVQCHVYWDSEEGKVTVLDQWGRQVIFVPGDGSYTVINAKGRQKTYALDVPATVIDGRVLLPLRALLETFAFKVSWYGDELLILAFDTYPSWRKLMKADEWKKALEEDCLPCALIKEAP